MSVNSQIEAVIFRKESVRGVYEAPEAQDNTVELVFDGGINAPNFNNEKIGNSRGNVTAPLAGGRHEYNVPDVSNFVLGANEPTDEPQWWKLAVNLAGARVELVEGKNRLIFDRVPSCNSMSADVWARSCANLHRYKARGVVGNLDIGWSGANACIMASFSGLLGAFEGMTKESTEPPMVSGHDTTPQETAGNYSVTINDVVYDVPDFQFSAGNNVAVVPANNKQGVATAGISSREMKVTMSLMQLSEGSGILPDAMNRVARDITIAGGDNAKYNLGISVARVENPSFGDVDGFQTIDAEYFVESFWMELK